MIAFEPMGHVAVVRLDRAAKRNAMTPAMLTDLVATLDRCTSARAIVLSGVGEVFCSGFDLSMCRDENAVLGDLLSGLSHAIRAVRNAPCPVVASAHGAAVAGGCALVAGCDIVVTHAEAKLGYPVLRMGISPAVNGPTLRGAIGDGAARNRMIDTGLIDGREALRIGLAHHLAESAAACEALAIDVAQRIAAKPPHAVGFTKHWLNTIDGTTNVTAADNALGVSLALVGSEEQRERLADYWNKQSRKQDTP